MKKLKKKHVFLFLLLALFAVYLQIVLKIIQNADSSPIPPLGHETATSPQVEIAEKNEIGYKKIFSAEYHLIDIDVLQISHDNEYQVEGIFCELNWELQKEDPARVPKFRDLVKLSGCDNESNTVRASLSHVVTEAKRRDQTQQYKHSHTHSIPVSGFVFHESRCGSTLIANMLSAFDPQQNRVYSESSPLIKAMKACGQRSIEEYHDDRKSDHFHHNNMICNNTNLVHDVVYMMGRTNDPKEKRLFFKLQSIGALYMLDFLTTSFQNTPWIFVYRDPVQVMMSHIPDPNMDNAVCLRRRGKRPIDENFLKFVQKNISYSGEKNNGKSVKKLSKYEYCAAHLAHLCDNAIKTYHYSKASSKRGMMVNYDKLPDILPEFILPMHFGQEVGETEKKRIKQVASVYSKGRTERYNIWVPDSKRKEQRAYPELEVAAQQYLYPTYKALEKLSIQGVNGK